MSSTDSHVEQQLSAQPLPSQTPDQGPVGFAENPSSVLVATFKRIYEERMQGLPVVNPALQVEAVDFIEWEGHWLGVLLTPWFINLLVVPKAGSPWPELEFGKGKELLLEFPQGTYKFSAREEPGIGSYLNCSLASPVHEWRSQAEARQTARDVMRLIKTLPVKQIDPSQGEADNAPSGSESAGSTCALSRRSFLGGSMMGHSPG